MQGLDHFEVECTEETGARYYERIAGDVLLDHDLLKAVHKVHIYIDPAVPVFVAAGLTRKLPSVVTLGDFASINRQEGKAILNITDETYLAPLLRLLWSRFGNDRVSQPDRFTVLLSISMDESEDLEELEVADPTEALYRDLIYTFHLIAPEGFKVRRQHIREGRISYIASEDAVPDHVADGLFRRVFEAMGEEP